MTKPIVSKSNNYGQDSFHSFFYPISRLSCTSPIRCEFAGSCAAERHCCAGADCECLCPSVISLSLSLFFFPFYLSFLSLFYSFLSLSLSLSLFLLSLPFTVCHSIYIYSFPFFFVLLYECLGLIRSLSSSSAFLCTVPNHSISPRPSFPSFSPFPLHTAAFFTLSSLSPTPGSDTSRKNLRGSNCSSWYPRDH